jgi:hypothetical protein
VSKFTQTMPETTTEEFWVIRYENKPGCKGIDCYLTNTIDIADPYWRYQIKPQFAARFASEEAAMKAIGVLGVTGPGEGFLPPRAVRVVVTVRTDYTVHLS